MGDGGGVEQGGSYVDTGRAGAIGWDRDTGMGIDAPRGERSDDEGEED